MYSPLLGGFLSRDPIMYYGGVDLYAYVGGKPLRYTDPMGSQEVDSAGRECCGDQMSTIELRVEMPPNGSVLQELFENINTICGRFASSPLAYAACVAMTFRTLEIPATGHAFIWIDPPFDITTRGGTIISSEPNGYGLYPVGRPNWLCEGVILDDTGHAYNRVASFRACPETLDDVMNRINSDRAALITTYTILPGGFSNGVVNIGNCTSWACSVLERSGISVSPSYRQIEPAFLGCGPLFCNAPPPPPVAPRPAPIDPFAP